MIMFNTSDREEDRTNGQDTPIGTQNNLIVSNAEEVRDDQPDLLIIEPECKNPFCQICFGIDGKG